MIELKVFYLIIILFLSLAFNIMLLIQVIELLKDNETMKAKLGREEKPEGSAFMDLLRKRANQ